MKILLLSPNYRLSRDWSFELFRDAIARHPGVEVVRINGRATHNPVPEDKVDVRELVSEHQPDVVMIHHLQFSAQWKNLRTLQKVLTACWVNDYFPRHYEFKNKLLNEHEFDLVFMTQLDFVHKAQEFQADSQLCGKTIYKWLPFSVETEVYRERRLDRIWDVTALMSNHAFEYPNRPAVIEEIRKIQGIKSIAQLIERASRGVYHNNYARLLSTSRIGIASCDQHGSCNLRHYEIPASGALLVTDIPHDFEALGFLVGRHYVAYSEPKELSEIIPYILDHWARFQGIADTGAAFVRAHHNNDVRVHQMINAIGVMYL